MRWPQGIVLFGLAVLVTFQVEKSSAGTLRNAVTEDEPLPVEIVNDESFITKELAERVARQRVTKLRNRMNVAMQTFEKIGSGPDAKESAEKIHAELRRIRYVANRVVGTFKTSVAAVEAAKLLKTVDENIEKVRAKIEELKVKPQPANSEEELFAAKDPNFEVDLSLAATLRNEVTPIVENKLPTEEIYDESIINKERLEIRAAPLQLSEQKLSAQWDRKAKIKRDIEDFREYNRQIFDKVKKQGMAKGLGERLIAGLIRYQNYLKKIVEEYSGTELVDLAKKAIEEAEQAIKVIREAMNKSRDW